MHLHLTLAAALAACALALPSPAATAPPVAGDAVARVETYLGGLRTLSTGFVQVVRDRQGQIIDRATGTLTIARPDRFRWDYRDPYLQTIVADGRSLWLYDADLEQVTVRALETGLGSTPAMLLSGSGKVADGFASLGIERDGVLTWCRLRPTTPGTDFERVSLAFAPSGELAALELSDKLGQVTEIQFDGLRRNPAVDEALFRFTPPPGVDVIGRLPP